MFPATQQLLRRLSARYPDAREWFDALRQWYTDARLGTKVIAQLIRGDNLELVSVKLNGEELKDVTRELDGRRVLLRIPTARTRAGENALTLGLTDDAEQPLEVESVRVGQPQSDLRQRIDLDRVRPDPAPAFQLTGSERAEPLAGCWEVRAGGHLAFNLYLQSEGKVVVALHLPDGVRFPRSQARLADQKKLLKEVGKRVKEKLKKWTDEAAERDGVRHTSTDTLLDDLRAYAELHAKHIRPAIESDAPLQSAIDRAGSPDRIVAANARPVQLVSEVVALVPDPPAPVRRARLAESEPEQPHEPRRERRRYEPAPARAAAGAAKSGGFVGKLLVAVFMAVLGGGAYAAWKYDGLGWAQQQWAALTGKPTAAKGTVLAAMKDAATDLKWQPQVCQELPREQVQAFAGQWSELLGVDAPNLDRVKMYMAGDRKNAQGEALAGFPVCDNMLIVQEFESEAVAKQLFDRTPEGYRDGLKRWGGQGEVANLSIPHTDAAIRLTTTLGEFRTHETIARKGRFVLKTSSIDTLTADEQQRRLTALAKRLNEHLGG